MAKILSIVPAPPGWFTIHKDEGGGFRLPIALWALCEADDDPTLRYVAPICTMDSDPMLEPEEGASGYIFDPGAVAVGASDPR